MANTTSPRCLSIYRTNKAVIELRNKLQVTTPGQGSFIHRDGEKDEKGRKLSNSAIGIVGVDFSANPSVYTEDNISPMELKLLLTAAMKRQDYEFSSSKIFGEPDEKGLCIARKLTINRQSKRPNGEVSKLPWYICLENSRAKKIKTSTGGFYMDGKTYDKANAKVVRANMSDDDFYQFIFTAVSYVNEWEKYYWPKFIEANEKAIEESDLQWKEKTNSVVPSQTPSKPQTTSQEKSKSITTAPAKEQPKRNLPPDAKSMNVTFATAFGEIEGTDLLNAELNVQGKSLTMFFEKKVVAPRLKELEDAMEKKQEVTLFYRLEKEEDNKFVYFVA